MLLLIFLGICQILLTPSVCGRDTPVSPTPTSNLLETPRKLFLSQIPTIDRFTLFSKIEHILTMSISKSVDKSKDNDYISSLEHRLDARSEELEVIHMEAAIDAQLTDTTTDSSAANPVIAQPVSSSERQETLLFDDYVNPNAVSNCLSPYVPSQAERIAAFVSFAGLEADDFLLDIGCGDGRVCIAAATMAGCRTAGIDVSPPCIDMAKKIAREEGLSESQCVFFEADMTMNPDVLLAGKWMPHLTTEQMHLYM
jgi:2-polyprenyl-3-methyl-5-hydroxy-6-metoxy-1,4-benzoquinol methylase